MDWISLKEQMQRDSDYSPRSFELLALSRVRDGVMYDHLSTAFSEEESLSGEYAPMAKRRPSVQSNLCRTVVDDSISLLFSEYHFPRISATADGTREALELWVKHCLINNVMIEAGVKGSIGSVVILFQVLNRKAYYKALDTVYMTPTFDSLAPDTLIKVTERYKVDADTLIDLGYDLKPHSGDYWFQRVWNTKEELYYQPKKVGEDGPMRRDNKRSHTHNLGFCPMVWIKNLPPSFNDIDGASTFGQGINTVIEADYLLSQGGRGLKYSADPMLAITGSEMPELRVGAANALKLGDGAEAKLLEISGNAASAVIEQVKYLRELAIEAMHGVRTAPERMVGAQSGRALEMLHQNLIWLADKLRISYGEYALIALARMFCDATGRVHGGIQVGGKTYRNLNADGIQLMWPNWFQPTPHDQLEQAQGLQALVQSEIISHETATRIVSDINDIESVPAERTLIDAEIKLQDARLVAMAAQTQAKANVEP